MLKTKVGPAGFSLVEILIGSAIAMVVMAAVMVMFESQRKTVQYLMQKSEAVELKNIMIKQLSDPSVCTWQLKDKVIDVSMATTELSPSPTVLDLAALYHGINAASAPLAMRGQLLPGTMQRIAVQKISFKNIYSTGNLNEYTGSFEVAFDSSTLSLSMAPVRSQQILTTVPGDPPAAKRIASCFAKTGTGSLQFIMPIGTLAQYVTVNALSGWDGTCTPVFTNPVMQFYFASACDRYCTIGCNPPSCAASVPGQGYGAGIMVECNGAVTPNMAQCKCIP